MYVGNIMLLVLNLPMIGLWVQVLKIPYHLLFPLIVLFCIIGTFSVAGSVFDLKLMLLFGVVGYLMRKFRYEGAPLILAYVLGPLMEQALRQSLAAFEREFHDICDPSDLGSHAWRLPCSCFFQLSFRI